MIRVFVLAAVISLATACGYLPGRASRKRREAQKRYEADFTKSRRCATTQGAEKRLVRSFIISMMNCLPEEEHAAAYPLAQQASAKDVDAFTIYRRFKREFKSRITSTYCPLEDGWTLLDRYDVERPDFGKTEIKRVVATADVGSVGYVGNEDIRFPSFPDRATRGTVQVITSDTYVGRRLQSPRLISRLLQAEFRNEGGVSEMTLGAYSEKSGILDVAPEFSDQ